MSYEMGKRVMRAQKRRKQLTIKHINSSSLSGLRTWINDHVIYEAGEPRGYRNVAWI
jgi:hypothetical protein